MNYNKLEKLILKGAKEGTISWEKYSRYNYVSIGKLIFRLLDTKLDDKKETKEIPVDEKESIKKIERALHYVFMQEPMDGEQFTLISGHLQESMLRVHNYWLDREREEGDSIIELSVKDTKLLQDKVVLQRVLKVEGTDNYMYVSEKLFSDILGDEREDGWTDTKIIYFGDDVMIFPFKEKEDNQYLG